MKLFVSLALAFLIALPASTFAQQRNHEFSARCTTRARARCPA